MSRTLLINNANAVPVAAGGVTDPSQVATARIAGFDTNDYASGTLDLASAHTGGPVQFVQGGLTDNDTILTSAIDPKDVVSVKEVDYVAPVAQVTTITCETGTGFATVGVVRADGSPRPNEHNSAEIKIDGLTATQIASKFVTLLNSKSPNIIVATSSGDDLILTANLAYKGFNNTPVLSFATKTDGSAEDWDVVATTTPVQGTGTAKQVADMEEIAYGANYTNRSYLPVAPPSYVDATKTYKLITIEVKTNTTPNIAKGNQFQEITFALLSGESDDKIDLAAFFGV